MHIRPPSAASHNRLQKWCEFFSFDSKKLESCFIENFNSDSGKNVIYSSHPEKFVEVFRVWNRVVFLGYAKRLIEIEVKYEFGEKNWPATNLTLRRNIVSIMKDLIWITWKLQNFIYVTCWNLLKHASLQSRTLIAQTKARNSSSNTATYIRDR